MRRSQGWLKICRSCRLGRFDMLGSGFLKVTCWLSEEYVCWGSAPNKNPTLSFCS